MSSLLDQAVIDAKALREAALKNAEAAVINKYSHEVRSTLDKLLEQEEGLGGLDALGVPPETGDLGLGAGEPEAPEIFSDDEGLTLAATDGIDKNDGRLNEEDELVEVTIDLDTLSEAINKLESQLDEEEEEEIDLSVLYEEDKDPEYEEALAKQFSDYEKDAKRHREEYPDEDEPTMVPGKEVTDLLNKRKAKKNNSNNESLDALADAILEKLTVDAGADLTGWAGSRKEEKQYQLERELASRVSTDVAEEMKVLKKAQEDLMFENKKLKTKLTDLTGMLEKAKNNLQEVNVSNARLLYTNRVLRNTSLNERQKNRIVEAISKAGSVKEAKTIFESLQSTVESAPTRRPKSLSEAIERPSQLIRASRETSEKTIDPMQDRWKKLAGI